VRHLRTLALVLLAAVALTLVGFLLGTSWINSYLRKQLEAELAQTFGAPAFVGRLEVQLLPPAVRVFDVRAGSAEPVAQAARLTLQIELARSVRETRLVLRASAAGLDLDLSRLPPRSKEKNPVPRSNRLFPVEVLVDRLEEARVRLLLDRELLSIDMPELSGLAAVESDGVSLRLGVKAQSVSIRRKERIVSLRDVAIVGGVRRDEFYVDEGRIGGESLTVKLMGEPEFGRRQYRLTASLPLSALAVLFPAMEEIGAEARVDATLRGPLLDPEIEAELRLRQANVHGIDFDEIRGTLHREGERLVAKDVRVEVSGGSASAEGSLTLSEALPLRARAVWEGFDLGNLASSDARAWEMPSDGIVEVSGTLDPVALEVEAQATLPPPASAPDLSSTAVGAKVTIGRDVTQARGSIEQPPSNRIDVDFELRQGSQLSGSARGELKSLGSIVPPLAFPWLSGLSGTASVEAVLSGTVDEPRWTATVDASPLTLRAASLQRLRAELDGLGTSLTLRKLLMLTGGGSAQLGGALALGPDGANDWRIKAENLDASILTVLETAVGGEVLPHGGVLDGEVTARGVWAAIDLRGDVRLRRSWLAKEPIEEIAVSGEAEWPEWRFRAEFRHDASESIRVTGRGVALQRARLTADSTPWDLSRLRGAGLRGLAGTVRLNAELEGALDRFDGQVRLFGEELVIGGAPIGGLSLAAVSSGGEWSLTGEIAESVRVTGALSSQSGLPATVSLEWSDFDASRFLTAERTVAFSSSGSLHLVGPLLDPGSLSGNLRIDHLRMGRAEYQLLAREPIRIDGKDGLFEVKSFSLAADGSHLSISGTFSTMGRARLSIRGQGDLTVAELLSKNVSAARGTFDVSAEVERSTGGEWQLRGTANVDDAALDLGLPVAVTETRAAMTLAGSTIRIEVLEGNAGGGSFRVGGDVDLTSGPSLNWSLREVAANLGDGVEVELHGQGTVEGPWGKTKVRGAIEVANALYDRDLQLTDLLPRFRQQLAAAPRAEPSSSDVELELQVYSSGGVFIDNNIANVEMWLDLRLEGHTSTPLLSGVVGLLGGEVKFREREFEITAGTIDFRDRRRMNPVLNILAESVVATGEADYLVTVAVSGTAEEPRVQFTADDPTLSQNDVLSLVTFGKTPAQLQREGGGVSAVDALALLPTRGVEEQVGKLVGVDRLEVEATEAPNSGAIEPRVTIGKDLTDRMRASLSTTFGVEAHRVVQLEYRLTRRISLLGTWEGETESQAGAFGGAVKFRYEFRRLPFSLFAGHPAAVLPTDAK
jgi:autotransporter translocation and assembly factor TamB